MRTFSRLPPGRKPQCVCGACLRCRENARNRRAYAEGRVRRYFGPPDPDPDPDPNPTEDRSK